MKSVPMISLEEKDHIAGQIGQKQVRELLLYKLKSMVDSETTTTPDVEMSKFQDLKALYIPRNHLYNMDFIAEGVVVILTLCQSEYIYQVSLEMFSVASSRT